MNHLGSLKGSGQLRYDGQQANCSYAIDVYEHRELKFGQGRVRADDRTLFEAMGKMLELELSDGTTMNVLIHRQSLGSGEAEVKSSGPIPGF